MSQVAANKHFMYYLVPRAGLEPARPFGPEDFLTTMAFATRRLLRASVCGLDDAFSVHVDKRCLGGSRLVSTLCHLKPGFERP
jgi:hypothetical protein